MKLGRIDERTSVPLAWLIGGIVSTFTVAGAGTFWVASVNNRLERIEQHLGVKKQGSGGYLSEAQAAQSVNPKGGK